MAGGKVVGQSDSIAGEVRVLALEIVTLRNGGNLALQVLDEGPHRAHERRADSGRQNERARSSG